MTEHDKLQAEATAVGHLDTVDGRLIVAQAETGSQEQGADGQGSTPTEAPTPPAGAPSTITVALEAGNIARLPADASIDSPRVNGADIEFVQPDGSVIVIPNGAVQGLTLFVGNTQIPPQTVAALFDANDIQAAAGPGGAAGAGNGSSGGNFAVPIGNIGRALDFGDLLPPTALLRGVGIERPQYEGLIIDSPTVGANDALRLNDDDLSGNLGGPGDDPAGPLTGTLNHDYGLNGTGSLLLTGATFPAGLGFAAVVGNGGLELLITQNGKDVMRITLDDSTSGNYTVTQLGPVSHDVPGLSEENISFDITYRVTDSDGDPADGVLTVNVDDDTPVIGATAVGGARLVVDETRGEFSIGETEPVGTLGQVKVALSNLFTLSVSAGADGLASTSYALSIASNEAPSGLLYSPTKQPIVLVMNGAQVEGHVGTGGGALAFTVSIDGVGNITLTQYLAVEHLDTASADELSASFGANTLLLTVTIKDGDGDEASTVLDLGSKVAFEDDGPTLVSRKGIEHTVDEDDILVVGRSIGSHPNDGDGSDGSFTGDSTGFLDFGPANVAGSVAALVNFGSDGAGAGGGFGFAGDYNATLSPLNLASKGVPLTYGVSGDTLTAMAGSRVVFTLKVEADGDYQFSLYDQLDHVKPASGADENTTLEGGANAIDFGATIVATDSDGDTIGLGGGLLIKVTDDIPSALILRNGLLQPVYVTRDESGGSADDNTTSSGVIAQFSGLTNPGVDPDMPVGYARAEATRYSSGNQVSLFSLPGADDNATITAGLALSGAQGSSSGLFTTEMGEIFLFDEGGLIVGRVGGAGGPAAFALAIDAQGGVSVAQYLSLHHNNSNKDDDTVSLSGKLLATVTVTDYDGDTVTDAVQIGNLIRFDDSGPRVANTTNATYDEEALTSPYAGNPGDSYPGATGTNADMVAVNATGNLGIRYGADGPAATGALVITINTASLKTASGQNIEWNSATNIAYIQGTGTEVFRLTVNGNSYTYSQSLPLKHAGQNAEDDLVLNFSFTAKDADGDTRTGSFTVTVDDDAPTLAIVDSPDEVNEGQTIDGTWTLAPGADGVTSVTVSAGGGTQVLSLTPSTGTVTFNLPSGTLTVDADKQWHFVANAVTGDTPVSFSIAATDGDGDLTSDTQTITVRNVNTAPTVGDAPVIRVSEEGLANGNPDSAGTSDTTNATSASGTLGAADAEGDTLTYTFTSAPAGLASGGVALTWSATGTNTLVGSAAGKPVITLTVDSAGLVTAVLSGPIDHANAGGENERSFSVNLSVSDGTVATATSATIIVEDDAPDAFTPDTILAADAANTTAVPGLLNLAGAIGADGLKTLAFNVTNGVAVKDVTGADIYLNGDVVKYVYNAATPWLVEGCTGSGTLAFTATLDPASDTWSFKSEGTLYAGNPLNISGVDPGGGNTSALTFNLQNSAKDLLVTADGAKTVNTSKGVFGIGDGRSIDEGDAIRFDFTDVTQTTANNLVGQYDVSNFTFTMNSVKNAPIVTIRAVRADNDATLLGDADDLTVNGVIVSVTRAGAGLPIPDVSYLNGVATITGLEADDIVMVSAGPNPFNAIEISGVSNNDNNKADFTISGVGWITTNAATPFDVLIPVAGTDGDGDPFNSAVHAFMMPKATSVLNVVLPATSPHIVGSDQGDVINAHDWAGGQSGETNYINGGGGGDNIASGGGNDYVWGEGGGDAIDGGAGNDHLYGGLGNDTLTGGSDNDILTGGDGDDILIGGLGNDTFRFAENGPTNVDTITDYLIGDTVDLSALLSTFSGGANDVRFKYADNSTKLIGDAAGGFDGDVTVQVQTAANTWQDVVVLKDNGANLSGAVEQINLIIDNTGVHQYDI